MGAKIKVRTESEVFAFTWRVPVEGFHWIPGLQPWNDERHATAEPIERSDGGRAARGGPPWLVEGGRPDYAYYAPLRVEALHRKFSDLYPTTQVAVLKFAEQYGPLGLPERIPKSHLREAAQPDPSATVDGVPTRDALDPPAGVAVHVIGRPVGERPEPALTWEMGESLSTWKREVKDLRLAIELWEAVTTGKITQTRRPFRFEQGQLVYREAAGRLAVVPHEITLEGPLRPHWNLDKPSMKREAALYLVKQAINVQLTAHASPSVHATKDGSFGFYVTPRNLIGAIWLHFALAVTGKKRLYRCGFGGCPEWIEVSAERRGRPRRFCDDPCRARNHEAKVAKARKLRQRGLSVSDIAAQLGMKRTAVHRALSPRRSQRTGGPPGRAVTRQQHPGHARAKRSSTR